MGLNGKHPRDAGDSWLFRVKDGVEQVRFGDPGWRLGYARDAINSYFVFNTLREKGRLPAHLRFQVRCRRSTACCHRGSFPTSPISTRSSPGTKPHLRPRSPRSSRKSRTRIWRSSGTAPAKSAMSTAISRSSRARARSSAIRVSSRGFRAAIPEDVALGYHLCFGTLGGWPRFMPPDLGAAVDLANALDRDSPPPRRLAAHPACSTAATTRSLRRWRSCVRARRASISGSSTTWSASPTGSRRPADTLPDFGLAAYCGLGRVPPTQMPTVLDEHRKAMGVAA